MLILVTLFEIIISIACVLSRDVVWQDSEITQRMWMAIKNHDSKTLIGMLSDQSITPPASMHRSSDGKGALFWAYEYGFSEAIQILEQIGVDKNTRDAFGKIPSDYEISQQHAGHNIIGGEMRWEDTDLTARLFHVISARDTEGLIDILSDTSIVPPASMARSSDGRGPLFWAYEFGHSAGVQILEEIGVDPNARDGAGITPRMLGAANDEKNRHNMNFATGTPVYDYDDDDDYMDDSEF